MVTPCDIHKRREIVFHALPPGQAERALALLGGLPGLEVERTGEHALSIRYCVHDYTLEWIEAALAEQGFHLEATLLIRIRRALYHYSEHVQRQNMRLPEVQTKNYKAHVEAWEKRPHGDSDETPAEWRQYK
jgi:hypothetical protein